MGSHIFLSGQANFQKCVELGVYGGIRHSYERTNAEIIAGFEAIKPGDFIFIYVNNVGFHGLWRATSPAFYDEQDIWGAKDQLYPYRVCFEPIVRDFPKPISLSDVLDLRDSGLMWSFDLNVVARKNHHPITMQEGRELIRLLLRNNPIFHPVKPLRNPHPARESRLPIKLDADAQGRIKTEAYLNAWLMRNLREGKLKELIGEYHDFLNFVPTSFNTV